MPEPRPEVICRGTDEEGKRGKGNRRDSEDQGGVRAGDLERRGDERGREGDGPDGERATTDQAERRRRVEPHRATVAEAPSAGRAKVVSR